MNELLNKYSLLLWDTVTFEFAIKFAIVYFVIIWIALISWVLKDIRIRTNNIFFQIICVLIIFLFTPFLGIFIYLLIRPGKTLYEKYYDEIEDNLDLFNELLNERRVEIEAKAFEKMSQEKENIIKTAQNKKHIAKAISENKLPEILNNSKKQKTKIKGKKF